MKRFTESFNLANPGNQLITTGVTNHYTPIQNILTNINNLFCLSLGIVACVGEDGVSIKLSSSQFVTQEKVNELLWRSLYNDVFTYGTSSLQGYITAQGLPKVTTINIGGYYVVYFSPDDIKQAGDPCNMAKGYDCCKCPCPCEANESAYDEFELNRIYEEDLLGSDDSKDDDNKDDDKDDNSNDDKSDNKDDDTLNDILNNDDIVKAAKQLEIYISQKVSLPREYYFTAIKFKNDDEAIALRWRYDKKLPTGNSTENTRSLIHIFVNDKKVWVQDFAKDSIVKLPKEIETLINNILKFLNAKSTNEPDIFELKGGESKDDDQDKDDDQNNDDQNNDDQNNDDKKDKDKNTDLI